MLAHEIADTVPEKFSKLDPDIKNKITQEKCVNCDEDLNRDSLFNIMYVLCRNGDVRWWHIRENGNGSGCLIK